DSPIIWGRDVKLDPENSYEPDYYYSLLGGEAMYPMTVILDQNGIIVYSNMMPLEYEELKEIIESIPAV
ncbi:MAG: hypothetical protein IKV43_01695, partial [Clostridia bacterium]|nr:hypothetical protein [Clostridia bacterium]